MPDLPDAIAPEQRKHILGLQANLWAEMMRTEARVTYMAFPRVAALAEVAWSPAKRINWGDFQTRIEKQLPRYTSLGIDYAREVGFEPGPRRRVSHDLDQCGEGYLLSLEDDAPIEGERATFLVNITNPCWMWRGASGRMRSAKQLAFRPTCCRRWENPRRLRANLPLKLQLKQGFPQGWISHLVEPIIRAPQSEPAQSGPE